MKRKRMLGGVISLTLLLGAAFALGYVNERLSQESLPTDSTVRPKAPSISYSGMSSATSAGIPMSSQLSLSLVTIT